MEYVNPAMAEDLSSISIDAAEVAELRRLLDEYPSSPNSPPN
jgi:hypothetical protein